MIKIRLTLFDFGKSNDFWALTVLMLKIYLFKIIFEITKFGFSLYFYWNDYHIGISKQGFDMGKNKKVEPPERSTDIHNILEFIYDNDLKPDIDVNFHSSDNYLPKEKSIDFGQEVKNKIKGEIEWIDDNSVLVMKRYDNNTKIDIAFYHEG